MLPETSGAKGNEGEVIAVGPGLTLKDGSLSKMPVGIGDKVLLPEYGGTAIKLEKDELFLYRSDEILAKFD